MTTPASNTELPLAGQVALVTGGASGIGRATCHALAGAGADLIVADFNAAGVEAAVAELSTAEPPRRVIGVRCDVRKESDTAALADAATRHFGRLDILVHSAGILRPPGSAPLPLAQLSVEEFDAVLETNLKGAFLCNRAVLPLMMAQKSGQIINVASTSGRKGRALDSAYCASKFGLVGLTESLAEEVRSFGIRVQLILPDAVATPLWDQNGPVPVPQWALPAERIAEVILYMLTLPADAVLGEIAVYPLRSRKRKAAPAKTAASQPPTET